MPQLFGMLKPETRKAIVQRAKKLDVEAVRNCIAATNRQVSGKASVDEVLSYHTDIIALEDIMKNEELEATGLKG